MGRGTRAAFNLVKAIGKDLERAAKNAEKERLREEREKERERKKVINAREKLKREYEREETRRFKQVLKEAEKAKKEEYKAALEHEKDYYQARVDERTKLRKQIIKCVLN